MARGDDAVGRGGSHQGCMLASSRDDGRGGQSFAAPADPCDAATYVRACGHDVTNTMALFSS